MIFEDMLHKTLECYIGGLLDKSQKRINHLYDLRLQKCQQKLNLKCAFGVTSGKFLGFIVRHRGIEINQSKVRAIQDMLPPKNLKEVRGLQRHLAYIKRFMSNLVGHCHPFSHLMKKASHFKWDDSCQKAFDNIKKYLSTPPVLGAPTLGKPLLHYIAAQECSLGALCTPRKL